VLSVEKLRSSGALPALNTDSTCSSVVVLIRSLYVVPLCCSLPIVIRTLTALAQIWYAHKKVCGVHSKPFRFPLLSPQEYLRAREILYTRMIDHHKQAFTVAGDLEEILGCRPTEVSVRVFLPFFSLFLRKSQQSFPDARQRSSSF
jgi:hypothetical protein